MSTSNGIGIAFRFTEEDEQRIRSAMRSAVDSWNAEARSAGTSPNRPAWRLSLARIGAHAIGCSSADLRDVETEWIESASREMLPDVTEGNR